MKIVASLGVRDEVDLIDRALAHLDAIGVDRVIVNDGLSTDGTLEILEQRRANGELEFFEIPPEASHRDWEQQVLERVRRSGADWVIFVDADEFPLPASGSLRDCAALIDADVVSIDRFNVPLSPDGPMLPDELRPATYDEVALVVEPVEDFWSRLELAPELSWMRSGVAPRVMARPSYIAGIGLGSHDVVPPAGSEPRRAKADDLLVAHLPFTTRTRFAKKVENIRESLGLHPTWFPEGSALHWKRWAAQAEAGELDEEFDRMVFDRQTVAALQDEGCIRSAAEVLRRAEIARGA